MQASRRTIPLRNSADRDFLKASTATAAAAAGMSLFNAPPAAATGDDGPRDSGRPGRRYVIRNGHVMSMDPKVGDMVRGDVLVEGKKILAVGRNLNAGGADEIDAEGRIVMPGFVDTHHHQFETAIRNFLADGLLFNDGSSRTARSQLLPVHPAAPSRRCTGRATSTSASCSARLSQLDAGVTTVARHFADPLLAGTLRGRDQGAVPTPSGASCSASSRARAPT